MATGATEFIDSTTADVFIPEIWGRLAIVAREQALVFANLVNRRYESELSEGDILHVPSVTNLTAQTKTKASNAAVVFETQTETNTDITVATWEYVAISVESIVKVQGNRDMLKLYAGKMGYALGLAIDDVLAGRPDDFTNAVGTLAAELDYDFDILRAVQYLDDANADQRDRVMVVSPAQAAGFLKLDKFIHNDYKMLHGESIATTNQEMSYVTSFLGMPIYKSTNVEGTNAAGHDNTMFQKEAIGLIVQMKPTAHSMYDINYLVDKVVLEQLHGSAILRNDHGVFMRGT